MRQFRAAWEKFSADPARLTEFIQAKRKRLLKTCRGAKPLPELISGAEM